MSNPDQYTVGWVCALHTEYVAAQSFLEREHPRPTNLASNDKNHYTLGEIGGHNVVIAVLPHMEYGIASAANVVTSMLNSFRNVRFGLLVGIGGGAPTVKNDIRLGDVVVGSCHGAATFQYDFGKSVQGRPFCVTGHLNQPPTILSTAVSGLKARYELKGHGLVDAIDGVLELNKRKMP